MESMFEATQKLWTDELNYWTGQMTRVGEAVTGEAEKARTLMQDAWGEMIKRQTGLVTEYTRHAVAFAEKQAELLRGAVKAG